MSHFPSDSQIHNNLYSAKTVRDIDQAAISELKNSAIKLMNRAGTAAFEELIEAFGQPSLITIFCGSGNNAGDGYILAGRAAQRLIAVRVIELGDSSHFSAQTQQARKFAEQNKVEFTALSDSLVLDQGIIVDSLLGTGAKGALKESYAIAVDLINHSGLPVLAMDIATGLNADTGAVSDRAVKADITVTFVGAKPGLFTGRGPAVSGEVVYHSLDINDETYQKFSPVAELMDLYDLLECLPQFEGDEYKNQRGHCMVIGGDHGYGGAALLAAEASLKVGTGLTSVATQPEHIPAILARCPEIMACGVISGQQLEPLLDRPSVLVVGPGLGRSPWSEQLLQKAVATGLPMVLDADALNILAEGRVVRQSESQQWVLTPHMGEAARLLGVSVEDIQSDRFSAVAKIKEKYNAVVLLKGPGTLISSEDQILKLCPYGNPGMATAGVGDLLSGIIGGLLAQGLERQQAAELGCCLHSAAADEWVSTTGYRGVTASDILPWVQKLLNQDFS
jgi:hydroxyethylthiazole kinase-like uncharacterized protein yjeF